MKNMKNGESVTSSTMDATSGNTISSPILVSAPGKVILFGEHSVVYGKQAVALSVNLRTKVRVSPSDKLSLSLPDISVKQEWSMHNLRQLWTDLNPESKFKDASGLTEEDFDILKKFLKIGSDCELTKQDLGLISFFYLYSAILEQPTLFCIGVESEIPIGSGLGSSAAYSVSLAAAFLKISGKLNDSSLIELSPKVANNCDHSKLSVEACHLVSNWAFMCEKILHGTPSGIDNAICSFGGTVSFKIGDIKPLKLPAIRVLLVNTKVFRNTKLLVAGVRSKYNKHKRVVEPILDSMDEIAKSALITLEELNNSDTVKVTDELMLKLNELVTMNQSLLDALGVSHPSLRKMVEISSNLGLSAKLTGAGGGGFGVILLPLPPCDGQSQDIEEKVTTCRDLLSEEGFDTWVTELGVNGVCLDYC